MMSAGNLTLRQKRMHLILDELVFERYNDQQLLGVAREVLGFGDEVCISYLETMKQMGLLVSGNGPHLGWLKGRPLKVGDACDVDERTQLGRIEEKLDLLLKRNKVEDHG